MLKITEDDIKKYKSAPCRMTVISESVSVEGVNLLSAITDVDMLLINLSEDMQIAIAHPFSMGIWDLLYLVDQPSFVVSVNFSLKEKVKLVADMRDVRKAIDVLLDSE